MSSPSRLANQKSFTLHPNQLNLSLRIHHSSPPVAPAVLPPPTHSQSGRIHRSASVTNRSGTAGDRSQGRPGPNKHANWPDIDSAGDGGPPGIDVTTRRVVIYESNTRIKLPWGTRAALGILYHSVSQQQRVPLPTARPGSGDSVRGPAVRPGVRRFSPGSGGSARGSARGSAARPGVRRWWWRGMSRGGGGVMVHSTGQTGQSAGHGTPTAPRARLCGRPAPGAAGGEWLQAHRPRSQPSRSVPPCDVQLDQSGHGQSAFPAGVQAGQIQPTAGPGHTDRCRRQQGAGPTADARRKNSDILDQSQPQTLEMKNIPASVH